jgi:hypothetical protein
MKALNIHFQMKAFLRNPFHQLPPTAEQFRDLNMEERWREDERNASLKRAEIPDPAGISPEILSCGRIGSCQVRVTFVHNEIGLRVFWKRFEFTNKLRLPRQDFFRHPSRT